MNYQSLEQIYSSKSNDELLALSADNASLRDDAKEILIGELRRRGLDGVTTAYDGTGNRGFSPQAPSRLLRSLKFGAILILNVCVAVLGTAALEAEIGGAIHPRSISALLWKWWTLDLLCAALIGFLMWKTWKTEASKWTWTLPAAGGPPFEDWNKAWVAHPFAAFCERVGSPKCGPHGFLAGGPSSRM